MDVSERGVPCGPRYTVEGKVRETRRKRKNLACWYLVCLNKINPSPDLLKLLWSSLLFAWPQTAELMRRSFHSTLSHREDIWTHPGGLGIFHFFLIWLVKMRQMCTVSTPLGTWRVAVCWGQTLSLSVSVCVCVCARAWVCLSDNIQSSWDYPLFYRTVLCCLLTSAAL